MQLSRNELALVVSKFLFSIGFEAAYFIGITGYAAYDLNASATLIAAVMFVLNAAHMLGSLAGGYLTDRMGPRAVIALSGVLGVSSAIGAQFVGSSIPSFMVLSGAVGFGIAIGSSAFESFAPYLEENREGLVRINSILKLSGYTAVIIGPAVGAVIVTYYATQRVFLFTAAAMALGVVAIWLTRQVRNPNGCDRAAALGAGAAVAPVVTTRSGSTVEAQLCDDEPDHPAHPLRDALEGARLLLTVSSLRLYLILGIMMWFSFGAFDALESLYYRYTVNVDVQWMGWANTAVGVGLLLGVLLLTRIPVAKISTKLLGWFVLSIGATSIIYVGTSDIRVVILGAFLVGLAFGLSEPLLPTLVQSDAPFWAVGRVMGTMQFFRVGSTLLPLAVAPALSELFGVQGVLVGASALTVVLALAVLPATRRLDRERASLRHIERIDPLADTD